MKKKQYVPENFNPSSFVLNHRKSNPWLDHDELIVILNSLNDVLAFRDYKKDLFKNGFAPLCSHRIQKLGIRNFPLYRDLLLQENVIETDSYWIDSEKCSGFRFSSLYQRKVKPVYITSKKLIRAQLRLSIQKGKAKKVAIKGTANSSSHDKYGFLKKWYAKLELDSVNSLEYIDLTYREDLANKVENANDRYNAACSSIHRFENSSFHFTVDDQGRFHSNLTNMKSEIRNFLTYNNKPLVSLDLKNSQPYLSLVLLEPSFWDIRSSSSRTKINIGSLGGNYLQCINTNSTYPLYTTSLNLVNNSQPIVNQDITLYRNDVLSGSFYHSVRGELRSVVDKYGLERIRRQGNWDINLLHQLLGNYKSLKTAVLTSFYSRNQTINSPSAFVKRAIRKRYPSVYNLFSLIKSKDHSTLPRLLQNVESELIINRVARRVNRERRRLPIFTIHDSVITVVDQKDYLMRIMKEEMKSGVGYVGKIKPEYWKPEESGIDDLKMKYSNISGLA